MSARMQATPVTFLNVNIFWWNLEKHLGQSMFLETESQEGVTWPYHFPSQNLDRAE